MKTIQPFRGLSFAVIKPVTYIHCCYTTYLFLTHGTRTLYKLIKKSVIIYLCCLSLYDKKRSVGCALSSIFVTWGENEHVGGKNGELRWSI